MIVLRTSSVISKITKTLKQKIMVNECGLFVGDTQGRISPIEAKNNLKFLQLKIAAFLG